MIFGKFKAKKLVTIQDIHYNPKAIKVPKDSQFKCPVCNVTILQLSSFILHVGSHGSDFKHKNNAAKKIYRKKLPFTCDICSSMFPHKNRLENHMKGHLKFQLKDLSCDICGYSTENSTEIKYHLRLMHRKLKSKCRICKENCVTIKLRRLHEIVFHFLKGFDCLKCKLRVNFRKIKRHFKKHESCKVLRDQNVQCSICKETFETDELCKIHKLKDHLRRNKTIDTPLCETCGKKMSSALALKRHLKTHSDAIRKENWYQCEICKKYIKSFKTLQTHVSRHINPLQCSLCTKQFMQEGTLVTHLKNHESFQCNVCKAVFKRHSFLLEHIKIHETHKQHQCYHCRKSFSQLAGLNQHVKIHMEQNFICEFCQKSFKHSRSFQEHVKAHTAPKDYNCSTCGKTCPSRFSLYLHKKIHSSVTHECSRCGKQFKWKTSLKKHFLRQHNVPK